MVSLRKMQEQDTKAVLQLQIKEEQTGYVSLIEQMLAKGEPSRDYHLLECGGLIVGFFIIDNAYRRSMHLQSQETLGCLATLSMQNSKGRASAKQEPKLFISICKTDIPMPSLSCSR
jgi:hypothetical protein